MNTFPGPENSWEGVDAYFTYANSEGALIFWTLFVIALCAKYLQSWARGWWSQNFISQCWEYG